MLKINWKEQLKSLYQPSPKEVSVVNVPEMNFLMIDGEPLFPLERKDEFQWITMIGQPEWVTQERFAEIQEQVYRKKQLPGVPKLRLESFHEGQAAQIMHLGPYAAEAPTVARLHAFIQERGCGLRGRHHEIYLGDPNRSAPEKLKTIIRQPFD